MRMVNEVGSAYKTVNDPETIEELLASGWRMAEEKVEKATAVEVPAAPVAAPRIVKGGKNQLMYKGRYLSQWAGIATKAELIAIFDYFGIAYSTKTSKSDMQKALRQYIREVKAEQRSEKHDGD